MPLKTVKRLLKPLLKPPLDAMGRLLRRRELAGELEHVSREALLRDLDAVDVPRDAIVLVHSSLKALGFVDGGPEAVVDALVERFAGSGTLALPTFSIDGTMRNTFASGRVFDVRSTPCNLGAIPEVFRKRAGVVRSVHPTHSIAALGPDAAWLVADHHRAGTSFGTDTPMARMLERGGYLMGIGTGLGTVTFYHCLEDLREDFPLNPYSDDSPFAVTCIDHDGVSHTLSLPAHSPALSKTRIDRPENSAIRDHFTACLERNAGLSWFDIGQSRGWVVSLPAMYAECCRLMESGVTIYSTLD